MLNPRDLLAKGGISSQTTYEGVVVDNNDPEHLSRVRCQIQGIFDGLETEHLPWAIPNQQHTSGMTSSSGSFSVPKVGSRVGIMFESGSVYHPKYTAINPTKKFILEEALHNYPDRVVDLKDNGFLLIVDTRTNEMFLRNTGDCHIFVVGNANIQVNGTLNHRVKGDYNLHVDGDMSTKVAGNVKETVGGNLHVGAGGSAIVKSGGNMDLGASDLNLRAGHIGLNDAGACPDPEQAKDVQMPAWPGIRAPLPE